MLLSAASRGKITDILGSPRHTTWFTAMGPDRGPDSYPMKTRAYPCGHDGLPPLKLQRLNNETATATKQIVPWMVAMMSGKVTLVSSGSSPLPRNNFANKTWK